MIRNSIATMCILAGCAASPQISKSGGNTIETCRQLVKEGRLADARKVLKELLNGTVTNTDPRIRQLEDQLRCRIWSIDFDLDLNKIRPHTRPGIQENGGALEFFFYRDTDYQQIRVQASNCAKQELITDDAGNRILRAWPINGEPVHFHADMTQVPTGWLISEAFPVKDKLPEHVRRYLRKTAEVDPTTDAAKRAAAHFKRSTLRATIENIHNTFKDYFDGKGRDNGPRSPLSNSENALQQRFMPTCWVASKALTAVLRAIGVPARETLVLNRMYMRPSIAFTGYHATAEYYDPANGWLPLEVVDPDRPTPWTYNRSIPQQIVLATEVVSETDPGTVVRAYYEMYNEGGNHTESLRNMTARLVSTPLFPPGK